MTLQVALAGPSFMLPLFSKLMNVTDNTEDTEVYFENLSLDYKTDVWRKRWEMKYASPAPREDGKGFAAAAPCASSLKNQEFRRVDTERSAVKQRQPIHPPQPPPDSHTPNAVTQVPTNPPRGSGVAAERKRRLNQNRFIAASLEQKRQAETLKPDESSMRLHMPAGDMEYFA